MSTYRQSPDASSLAKKTGASGQKGPDQAFTKAFGAYAGAKRGGGITHRRGNSTMDAHNNTNNLSFVSPTSSICESYKNVDFFAVKEPYQVIKNRFSARSPHLRTEHKKGSMANVIGNKFAQKDLLGSTREIAPFIKSGTHITQGRQFLNEHR